MTTRAIAGATRSNHSAPDGTKSSASSDLAGIAATSHGGGLRRSTGESAFAWVLIAPGLILMGLLGVFPLLAVVGLSLFRIDLTSPLKDGWVGLANYGRLLQDARFWHSIQTSCIYTISTVAAQVVLGMALALLLFRKLRGQGLVRTLVLLPTILAPVVVGLLWRTLLLTPRFGIVDYMFMILGLGSRMWLADSTLALVSVTIIHTWQWTPYAFLVFLASLNALPVEPLEAARLDCRSRWQEIRYVILPLLRPAIFIVVILRSIVALNAFAAIYSATGGGPGIATEILNLYIYYTAFASLSVGYGSALGTVQLVITVVVALAFFRNRSEQ